MTTCHTNPRRRSSPSLHLDPKQCSPALPKVMTLQKGATFHSPKSPAGSDDPILDISSLPRRSPTCPQTLEELVAESDNRISRVLATIQHSLDTNTVAGNLSDKDECPVPRFLVAHAATNIDPMDVDEKYVDSKHAAAKLAASGQANHHHASDSGLGSSISSRDNIRGSVRMMSPSQRSRSSVYSSTSSYRTAINRSVGAVDSNATGLHLSDHATKKIKEHIIEPILAQERLKDYHNLVGSLPHRIGDRAITCLRDLEKTLIFLAPSSAKSAASYLNFCETSIQCIHTTVEHLNDPDLRRPTDRPYTNNYFVDLTHQIRQYAQIMAASKKKLSQGKSLEKDDFVPGENLRLVGGNDKPAELMREKDGALYPIDAGKHELPEDYMMDDAERAMARKRKCDIGKVEWRACRECGKQFTRPCDLTKHEKTHSRPWKCADPNCKYHELGWPTEKERDRHFNDKHTSAPALYHCEFGGCAYTSKRESNCKQHMEKAHGWNYIRSKSKKGQKLVPTVHQQTPPQSMMATPPSAFHSESTPMSDFSASPLPSTSYAFSPTGSMDTTSASIHGSNSMNFDFNAQSEQAFDFGGFSSAPLFPTQPLSPEASEGRRESMDLTGAGFNFDFDGPIDFNDPAFLANCPPPQDFMSNFYNQAQQPTPAMSDFDIDSAMAQPGMSMQGDDPTLMAGTLEETDFFKTAEAQCQPEPTHAGLNAADWDLFGPNGESSQMAHMLPDFGFGSQSNQDLYVDSSDDGNVHENLA